MTTAQTSNANASTPAAAAKSSPKASKADKADTTKGETAAASAKADGSKADSKADTKAATPAPAKPETVAFVPTKPIEEKIHVIAISDIDMTFPNARAGYLASVKDDENSFESLCESLETKGQEMPVILRPNPSKRPDKKPYQLVAGFRRVAGIAKLATEGKKTPHVIGVIRELSDMQAVQTNAVENTSRYGLSQADQCWACMVNKNAMIAEGIQVTDDMVAKILGLSQHWVNRLIRLANKLDLGVLEKWRQESVKINLGVIEKIAKLDKSKQDAAYDLAVKAASGSGNDSESTTPQRGPNSWIGACEKEAAAVGTLLANLEFNGFAALAENVNWKEMVDFISPKLAEQRTKVSETGRVKQEHIDQAEVIMAKRGELAYQQTMAALENPEEEETAS